LTELYSALLTHRSLFALVTCRFIWIHYIKKLKSYYKETHNYCSK